MLAYALNIREFPAARRNSFLWSAGIHALIIILMSTSFIVMPHAPMPQMAIEAIVVDETKMNKVSEQEKRKADEQRQRELEEQRRVAEQQQQEQQQQQREAEEQRREQAEAQQRKAAEQQRQEESRRIAEQKRVAEQQRLAEQQRQQAEAKRQQEAAERAAAERLRAEQNRKASENLAQARREAELAAAMAAEEELFSAQSSTEMGQYTALIRQKVQRNWSKPGSAKPGLECEVAVVQLPNGDVVDVRTVRCNGDDAVRRSIEAAVRKASPLPLPENRLLFDRNITFIFVPES